MINHLLKTVDVEIILVFENAKIQNFVSLSNAGGNRFVNFVSLSNAGGTSRDKSFAWIWPIQYACAISKGEKLVQF